MARNDIYLNINSLSVADAVVTGQQDMTAATIPELVLGDTPTFNFYFTDNTNVWPSWAGNASYSLTWALSDAVSCDFTPAATTGNATPITGGWSIVLPLNSYDLVGLLNTKRVGQPYPVQNLWQQLRVTDPSGNEVTRAMFWTPVRYRAISDTQNTESASPTGGRFVTVNNTNELTTPTAAQFYAANEVPSSALGTAANGELLIGNGTGFTKATLTAGSGVSITNGSGSITITATDGDITLDDGTAAAPSLKFTADTDTGLFRPSDNVVGISAGGVSRATFGATSAINGTTIPASKTLVVTTDKLSSLAATTSAELAGVISDETGTGALVFATSPTLTTPILGTPQSGTLSSCTGLPISTGVSGLGTNVATFLATPSSANLASAVTDETGTGALVFANTPTLVTPNIGAATGTSVNLSGGGTFGGAIAATGTSTLTAGYWKTKPTADDGTLTGFALSNSGATTIGVFDVNTLTGDIRVGGTNSSYPLALYSKSVAVMTFGASSAATLAGNLTVSGGTVGTAASTNLTLQGGSSGASLVLGQGASGKYVFSRNLAPSGFQVQPTAAFEIGTPSTTGSSLFIHTQGSDSTYASGLSISGTYSSLRSVVTLSAYGTYSGGGYNSALAFATTANTTASEVGRFTSTGNLLLGTTTDGGQKLQVVGQTSTGFISATDYSNGDAGQFIARGARGTPASPLAQNASDSTGLVRMYGYDGSSFIENARIHAQAVGTIATNRVGGVLSFWTHPDSTSAIAEAMRITQSQNLIIGSPFTDGGQKLQVNGTGYFASGISLATHITSAGGIGFGTDWSLYRVSGNTLAAKPQSGAKTLYLYGDTGNCGIFSVADAGAGFEAFYFNSTTHAATISTNGTTALTLDSSQNATFAGKIVSGTWSDVVSARLGIATTANSYTATIANNASSGGAYALRLHTTGTASSDYIVVGSSGASAGSIRFLADGAGNFVVNNAAIATNATDGFLYVSTCAGTPTGTPTSYTGRAPIVVDTTNNKLYFYSGGAWRDAGP